MALSIRDIKKAFFIIPVSLRPKFKTAFACSLINGFLDLLTLGMLIPAIIAYMSPTDVISSRWILKVQDFLGFESLQSLQFGLLLGALGAFMVKSVVGIWLNNFQNKTLFEIATALAERIFQSYFRQSYLSYTHDNSAIASRRINTFPHDFAVYILASYLNIFTEVIIGGIILIVLISYSPILALIILLILIPVLMGWRWFKMKYLGQIEDEFKRDNTENAKQLMKGLDSYVDSTIHQNQTYFIDHFIKSKRLLNQKYSFLKTFQQVPARILEIVLIGCITLIFGFFMFFDSNHSLITVMTLFVAAFYRIYPSITRIITASTSLGSYGYLVDELSEMEPVLESISSQMISFEDRIELMQVSFSYPDKSSIIVDLTLNIQKGECCGIIGESGVGKSTLVKLLMGLLTPTSGEIKIDGQKLSTDFRSGWLFKMAYLQQQPVIIDGTLLENVAFGEISPNMDRAREVMKLANLTEFVMELPDGLNTELGENGLRISGGQIQRIALARALYKNSEILIFDEVSNNLDETNLNEIMSSIVTLKSLGKTIIIIDHDQRMIELTDTLWVVKNKTVIVEKTESAIAGKH